jgi:hypothetical protein
MSSSGEDDNDQILSKVIREIDQDDGSLNKAQAYYDRANQFLEAANYRYFSFFTLKLIYLIY